MAQNLLTPGTWTLDPSHSEVGFTVRHAGISKVRGKFTDLTAELRAGDSLEAGEVSATVRMDSISTGDDNRDGHLKSADFFDVEQFPEMTFTSTGITVQDEDEFTLAGDLSLHGVTRPVEFEAEFNGVVTDPFGITRAGFSAKAEISRKDFGLTWNAAIEAGGVLVGDKVKITLEAEFTAPQSDAS